MTAELAPPLAEGAPPRLTLPGLLAVAAGALAASILFWAPLLFGGSLHGHDWSSHHFHYFDWVRQSLTRYHTLPLYMADAWITPNFLANAESPSLGPLAWLLWLLPTGVYVKLLLVVSGAVGLAGGWLLLRDLGAAPPVRALVAIGYAWSGFFAAHLGVGHHWAMGVLFLPALLWLYRRAVLGSDGALVAAAALDAATILGGQHQPFIWQNLLLAGFGALWAVRVRSTRPLTRLALLGGLAAGLAAVKLVPLWLEFGDYAPEARIQGLPLASLLPSLLARDQGPTSFDPRIVFEHGAGWWEYAFYVGPVVAACTLLGLGARGSWPLLAVAGFFLVLSLEPLRVWPLLEPLPVWRSQRCPSRFLVLALFGLLVCAGPGLERLRALAAARWPRVAPALAWALVLAAGADLWLESRPWQAASLGPAIESLDHRPRPLRIEGPTAEAELVWFAPNRLVYRVTAREASQLVLPLRFEPGRGGWLVEGAEPRARDGLLEIGVPAGRREVALRYRPPGLRPGAAISAATVLALAALALRRRRTGSAA